MTLQLRLFLAASIVVTLGAGCPTSETPIPDPITSIDGLEGGTVTSDVSIDGKLQTTGEATLDSVTVIDTIVSAEAAFGSTTTGTLTVLNDATLNTVSAETISTNELNVGGKNPFPTFVGDTQRPDVLTADAAHGACDAVATGAHICSEFDVRFAARLLEDSSVLNGLTIETTPRVIHTFDRNQTQQDQPVDLVPLLADNCADWTLDAGVEGPRPILETLVSTSATHAHTQISAAGSRISIVDVFGCQPSEMRLACCL